jgi:hypothetical protein
MGSSRHLPPCRNENLSQTLDRSDWVRAGRIKFSHLQRQPGGLSVYALAVFMFPGTAKGQKDSLSCLAIFFGPTLEISSTHRSIPITAIEGFYWSLAARAGRRVTGGADDHPRCLSMTCYFGETSIPAPGVPRASLMSAAVLLSEFLIASMPAWNLNLARFDICPERTPVKSVRRSSLSPASFF